MKFPFRTFGLDWTDGLVRVALLERRRKRVQVTAAWEAPMEQTPTAPDQQLNQLEKDLQDALRSNEVRLPKHVVVSLPDDACYLFTVTVASLPRNDVRSFIQDAAAEHVPFDLDDVYVDWYAIPVPQGKTCLQVLACPKTVVDSTLSLVDRLGLIPVALVPASIAALNALSISTSNLTFLLLTIGKLKSTLMLVHQGCIPMTLSTMALSDNTISSIFTTKLKLSASDAEKAKTVFGVDPSISHGVVRDALIGEFREIASEILRLQHYAQQDLGVTECRKLVVIGAGTKLRALGNELQLRTRMEVLLTPIRAELAYGVKERPAHTPPTGEITAIGLAFQGL